MVYLVYQLLVYVDDVNWIGESMHTTTRTQMLYWALVHRQVYKQMLRKLQGCW